MTLLKRVFLKTIFALMLLVTGSAWGQFAESDLGPQNPAVLVVSLMGPGVSASNVTFQGSGSSAGSFSGGTSVVGFGSGIILSTGSAAGVLGNAPVTSSTCNSLPGDTDLAAISGIPATNLYDATVLSFDFVPTYGTISFNYVFASEEYNQYVGSNFNDVFGFFVNGTNVALIPGTSALISVNTVNDCTNASYFIDNIGSPQGGGCTVVRSAAGLATAMNGLTTVLTATASVNPGVINHIKLAIADAGDCRIDSNVFIQANSFTSPPSPTNSPTPCGWPGPSCTFTPTPTITQTLSPTPTSPPCGWPGPSCTFTNTGTPTFTFTATATPSFTTTVNARPTNTPTMTRTPTFSLTPTITSTPTATPTLTPTATPTSTLTPCGWPGNTCTLTPTVTSTPTFSNLDVFYINKNIFNPSSDKAVSIFVNSSQFPGPYSLKIYNSAGEHVKTLDEGTLSTYLNRAYLWDGTNKDGDACASGVYIFYLTEPYSRKIKRMVVVH